MIRRAAYALVLGASLVLVSSSSGAPTWGQPVQISSGDRALGPELAVNAKGDAIAVWDREVGAECASSPAALGCVHIVEAATRTADGTWSSPIEVARPGVGAAPQVAIDDSGDAAILWIHDIGRDRVLQASYRKGLDGAFSEPSDVSEASLEVRDHAIAVDGAGDAVAAWAERSVPGVNSHFAVRVATRAAPSGGWGAPMTLASPDGNLYGGPSLAATPSGLAAVAWIQDGVSRVSRGETRTGSWAAPEDVSEGHTDALVGDPDIAMNKTGDVLVVWPGSAGDVRAAHFSRLDATWDRGERFGVLHYSYVGPRAAIDDSGRGLAVWASPEGLESASRAPGTGAWSRPVLVSLPATSVNTPALAQDTQGNTVALWTAGAAGAVQASLRPAASGDWLPPVRVSEDLTSSPRAGIDAAGAAVGVWMRFSGGTSVAPDFRVESSDLGGGPILDRLTVRERAIAGTRAHLSVRAVPWASPLAGAPAWSFGDGTSATGTLVSHVYVRPGRFTVSVTATDAAGGTTTARTPVVVIAERLRNRRLPSIAGKPRPGQTLTCRRGVWTGSPPIRFAYRWRRDGRLVLSATGAHYRVRPDDVGSRLACEVTATNAGGSLRAVSKVFLVEG